MNENLHTHPLKRTEESRTFQSGRTAVMDDMVPACRDAFMNAVQSGKNILFVSLGFSIEGEKRKQGLTDQSENGGIFLLQLLASLVVPLGGESVFAAALGLNAN